jgi:hypothetical protein
LSELLLIAESAGVGGNGFVMFSCAIQATAEYAMAPLIALVPTRATQLQQQV